MERLTDKQKHILQQKLCDMKNRCNNPNNKFYKDYGARGITVCDEWMDKKSGHANFQKWALENGWKEFLTIDRIDVNGNYEPSNCRWSTQKEQANNRRNNHLVTICGVTKTAQEWADQVGISVNGFLSRIDCGWNEDRLLEPKNKPLKMTKAEMAKEIKYWRNLEEQGLILKPPCKVGDVVYRINKGARNPVIGLVVTEIRHKALRSGKIVEKLMCSDDIAVKTNGCLVYYPEEIGKKIWLTRAEAEKALEEMGCE